MQGIFCQKFTPNVFVRILPDSKVHLTLIRVSFALSSLFAFALSLLLVVDSARRTIKYE